MVSPMTSFLPEEDIYPAEESHGITDMKSTVNHTIDNPTTASQLADIDPGDAKTPDTTTPRQLADAGHSGYNKALDATTTHQPADAGYGDTLDIIPAMKHGKCTIESLPMKNQMVSELNSTDHYQHYLFPKKPPEESNPYQMASHEPNSFQQQIVFIRFFPILKNLGGTCIIIVHINYVYVTYLLNHQHSSYDLTIYGVHASWKHSLISPDKLT